MKCPCCSGLSYAACCKPYHDGCPAPTPLALMRSRYSAYSKGLGYYIIATTHPKSPYYEKDTKKWEKAILEWSRLTKFLSLEIISHDATTVHFIAHLSTGDLNEHSLFEQIEGKWLYVKALKLG